jgi:Malic enzyme
MVKKDLKGKKGIEILKDPKFNKSTAFSANEQKSLGIIGLVPDTTESEDLQLRRVIMQLGHKSTDLGRYIYLNNLLDHDETLFYKVVMSDPARFLPIIYDPTIGEACLKYGHIFRNSGGMYISIRWRGHIKEILKNWPVKDVRAICVTNGGRILGLGDLGANGVPIPIGKLQLYTSAAGVPPEALLPVYLDAGTNNEQLIQDPLYLGIRQSRPASEDLYSFVDEFVEAVRDVFPSCCIHFEDWTGVDAINLLQRYRDKISCFNDDIQGTGSVTVAGLFNALKITGSKPIDQQILFLGSGSAAMGIANLIVSAMIKEGISKEEAQSKIWMFNTKGLIISSRLDIEDFQRPYAHEHIPVKNFVEAIEYIKPTAIIGVSTVGKLFTKEVINAMSRINKRPIIFPLSNPTDHAECTAEEAYKWSDGKAIFAAGVQFPPVKYKSQTFLPGQANNFYIFPAIGLAVYATQAKRVTDEMFIEAAHAVADIVTQKQLDMGLLYPPQSDILETEIKTAIRVAEFIFSKDMAGVERPDDIKDFIKGKIYKPEYQTYV